MSAGNGRPISAADVAADAVVSNTTSHGRRLKQTRRDVLIGMSFSNVILCFIILTTGATLHPAGHTQLDSAAGVLFAVGSSVWEW